MVKEVIIALKLLLLIGNSIVIGVLWNEVGKSQKEVQLARSKYEVVNTRNHNLEKVVALDETVMVRYQKSVQACRNSQQFMVDGDYYSALIEAKDVGETELDVQPFIEERERLLQGTNANLL